MNNHEEKKQRGVQSVEVASVVLDALARSATGMPLKAIAQAVEMSPAKLFPYMVSLVRSGLLCKDEATGCYLPGLLSQALGILGLHYMNPTNEADAMVNALAATTGHGVALSLWGTSGPTVIRIEEPRYSLYSEIRPGAVMSLLNTSIGRVFSTWMPTEIVISALAGESLRAQGRAFSGDEQKNIMASLDTVRMAGRDCQIDAPVPGLSSVSVPVFDISGAIAFALTLFDETAIIDLTPTGATLGTLHHQAENLSAILGYHA